MDTTIPQGVEKLHGGGMIPCKICKQNMYTGSTENGLIIARCTCNIDSRENVVVKCMNDTCREWVVFPKHGERKICKCGNNIYICKCNCYHTVPVTDTHYKCKDCDEPSDPLPSIHHV